MYRKVPGDQLEDRPRFGSGVGEASFTPLSVSEYEINWSRYTGCKLYTSTEQSERPERELKYDSLCFFTFFTVRDHKKMEKLKKKQLKK